MTPIVLASAALAGLLGVAPRTEEGLLFHLSGSHGLVADHSAAGQPDPTFASDVAVIEDGAIGPGIRCGNLQRFAYLAPGHVLAQRGTLAFFWRSREAVGPTEFPLFRVAYADHSSWDMVFLRIDYNGHGIDAFVTDRSLARVRVSHTMKAFPAPNDWMHIAFSWDETRGVRLYVDGRLVATNGTRAVLDAALDQMGPHSRIISPYQVQSDYNFTRGGDIDEVRVYDRMLEDGAVAELASRDASPHLTTLEPRCLDDDRWRDEWFFRYGWNRFDDPPPALDSPEVVVRKVEVHEAYDLGRWWWKATDGIRETTWPGVYNRSRLPGRNDYFQLPDWDCSSTSGKAITFAAPAEPWNHVEMSGAAWGAVSLEAESHAAAEPLFERPRGQEKTVRRLPSSIVGRRLRLENVEQETPLGEVELLHLTSGREPSDRRTLTYRLAAPETATGETGAIRKWIEGRHPADERSWLVAQPVTSPAAPPAPDASPSLPLVHIVVPNDPGPGAWKLDEIDGGLDGVVLELPALSLQPTHGDLLPMNVQVKDPTWPLRNMVDFTFSVHPGRPARLFLDLRDRIWPSGKPLYLTVASARQGFGPASLTGTSMRLVFKPRKDAVAEAEIDRFTQARDAYAMLVEEHPFGPRSRLWSRYETDLLDLLRVSPNHPQGVRYRAASMPNAPLPPFVEPVPPAGVPLWAFRQVELVRRLERFILYYVEHRQLPNGEFGGGLSDDGDLTNIWVGAALMGIAPDRLLASIHRELEAFYANGMFTRGLPTIQTDELHSYEEGIDVLGQNMILDFGSPKQIERAMETTRGVFGITGVNAAGHRHIRSSYYSGTKMAEEGVWGWAKAYGYLVLQPAQLLVDYNANPTARRTLLEIADGLLAHRRKDADGTYDLPTAIEFATDRDGEATRGYLPWPLFWSSWQWTGDRRYLDPIVDAGPNGIMAVNANMLDIAGLRDEWGPRILSGEEGRLVEGRRNSGPRSRDDRRTSPGHFRFALSGDKRILEDLYARQIVRSDIHEFIDTEGSLWIDRVGMPTGDLQRARLGGVALLRNAPLPGHLLSWRFATPATGSSVAILVTKATTTAVDAIAYNLEETPVRATMTGWGVDPGLWELTDGIDSDGDDRADRNVTARLIPFERSASWPIVFPPRQTTALTLRLKTPGAPSARRPDLGIDPEDVVLREGSVDVTIHGLGSVAMPEARLVVEDGQGRTLASAAIPPIAPPLDLIPRTARIRVSLPTGFSPLGARVRVEPPEGTAEITLLNNSAPLPGL